MAEEFAFDEVLWNGSAINLNKRSVGSGALAVVSSRDFPNQPPQLLHRFAPRKKFKAAVFGFFMAQIMIDSDKLCKLFRLFQGEFNLVDRERLDQIIEGAVPHARHRR